MLKLPFFRRNTSEFRPDVQQSTLWKVLHPSQLQRERMLKWGLYVLLILAALIVQDVIFSRLRIFGSTTNLPICVLLLMTVIESSEVGSLFILISAVLYYFSGSAPGAYVIALLVFPGVAMSLLRQMYFSRSRASIVTCAGMAQLLYELGLYIVGLYLGLTNWYRFPVFLVTAVLNILIMIPLYKLICKIGLIGGNTWKE